MRYYLRRVRVNTDEAKRLGEMIRRRRHELGLSTHDLGNLIGTRNSTILRVEQGAFAAPRPDKLARIAEALHLGLADVFATAGYVVPSELPSLRSYLLAKYHELPQAAIDELGGLFDTLVVKHGLAVPINVDGGGDATERLGGDETMMRDEVPA